MKIGNTILARDLFGNPVMFPAMEADPAVPDLTRTTSNMMKKASSRSGASLNAEGSPAEPTTEGNPQDAPTDPLDENPGENAPPEEGGMSQDGLPPDEGGGGMNEFGGGMDDGMGGGGDMGMDGEEQLTKEQAISLTRLHGNLNMLYQSVTTLVESLGSYAAPTSSTELRKIFNSASDHLSNTKEYLAEILSTPFTLDSYPEKLRKFVALKNVYNIVCDMLKIHFKALDLENNVTP